ncbi:hypothetical protein NP233_g12845 [Leucocoprinus birnbaumii]|uniref:Cyanovirin-N domain-containing protein n=1 Tax=Leucocoprinus birnbaumii TaxID=56174 RepID=A0AAD5VFQ0_9AGAR|nr:hypothetical protein NP233_g12845 [Leucocoprinus birnbaumii]
MTRFNLPVVLSIASSADIEWLFGVDHKEDDLDILVSKLQKKKLAAGDRHCAVNTVERDKLPPRPDRAIHSYHLLSYASLYWKQQNLALENGRKLVYYSNEKGISELDLSQYIGNCDGELEYDSAGFHLTAFDMQLLNGHLLVGRVRKINGTLVKSWINLDQRIHCYNGILEYDPGREKQVVSSPV